MPSFTRSSNSPKQPGSSGSLFNFSLGDSSKMSSFGSSDLPLRNSVAASDRASTIQGASTPKGSGHHGIDRVVRELTRYLDLLRPGKSSQQDGDETTVCGLHIEELLTTPLFSWSVKLALADERKRGHTPSSAHFDQFALLGQERNTAATVANRASAHNPDGVEPIFLNTNAPWSAFLCGSQGSGKSHTLSVMLEGCLLPNKALGRLPEPLQGIVFHADALTAGGVCEAAHLCSAGVPVNVLVSPSNYWRLHQAYSKIEDPKRCLRVKRMKLKPRHLNVERMLALMAFNESSGRVPLYMEVINKILREMATSAQQSFQFDYRHFMRLLDQERLTPDQKGPMNLRLQLLESFMDVDSSDDNDADMFSPPAGTLTIVDLTDPFIDASSACTLFDICLALFLEDPNTNPTKTGPFHPSNPPPIGRVIALDEAHKYLSATSAASDRFTDSLLTAIRIQRHAGTRIIVATQEPTVSPKLLDLCSLTLVHRFSSPAWLAALRDHLAGLSSVAGRDEEEVRALFEEIVTLGVGEGLLFAPSAMVRVVVPQGGARGEKRILKLGTECLRFRTRPRVTSDGGRSVLAIR
ncbi:hypothetical protein DBV05_g6553 [Lasiodiplodia theobromae]|uniref:Zona occludens toxin N-terminal domain-containing protein n=1 Tax=Lasiodiplodia theobromae TaxID=45133 RepID=A0A5N5DCC3_9PEZI|nr:hypothetical protein DBV05_g6553 [Lasiodiplodia theobromae]